MEFKIIEGAVNYVTNQLNELNKICCIKVLGISTTSCGPQNDSIGITVLLTLNDFEKKVDIEIKNEIDCKKMVDNYLFSDEGKQILKNLISILHPPPKSPSKKIIKRTKKIKDKK